MFRKTKIVCTLGPSTDDENVMRSLIEEGMNVARFNFSHGPHDEQLGRVKMLKKLRKELNRPVAALLDTKGPEIRLKEFTNGKEELKDGQTFTLTSEDIMGDSTRVAITYKELASDVRPGDHILIDDGLIGMEVMEVCPVSGAKADKESDGYRLPRVKWRCGFQQEGRKCAKCRADNALYQREGLRRYRIWCGE